MFISFFPLRSDVYLLFTLPLGCMPPFLSGRVSFPPLFRKGVFHYLLLSFHFLSSVWCVACTLYHRISFSCLAVPISAFLLIRRSNILQSREGTLPALVHKSYATEERSQIWMFKSRNMRVFPRKSAFCLSKGKGVQKIHVRRHKIGYTNFLLFSCVQ